MKRKLHVGWQYLATFALLMLGFVGSAYTAQAQSLTVMGGSINTSYDHSSIADSQLASGSISYDSATKTLTFDNVETIDSYAQVTIEIKNLDLNLVVKGTCKISGCKKNKSMVEILENAQLVIKGATGASTDKLSLFTHRGSSNAIRIKERSSDCAYSALIVGNVFLELMAEADNTAGIMGGGSGSGVNVLITNGARLEAKGTRGATYDINGQYGLQLVDSGYPYGKSIVTYTDEPIEVKDGTFVYSEGGGIVKGSAWACVLPNYPATVAGKHFHPYRTTQDPSNNSAIKSGSVSYGGTELTLKNVRIEHHERSHAIWTKKPESYTLLKVIGTNKITCAASPLYFGDKQAPDIQGEGSGASLELIQTISESYPCIWMDNTQEVASTISGLEKLKLSSSGSYCIYAPKANLTLKGIDADFSNSANKVLISTNTLSLDNCYIASPAGAVVQNGSIKLNGESLANTSCSIRKGAAPTYRITIDNTIKNGTVRVTNYSNLSSVPMGTTLKVEATPNTGYRLTKVTACGENITSTKQFVVSRNGEISAQFDPIRYHITASYNSEGGSLTLSKEGYQPYGTEITVTATPKEGYELTTLMAGSQDIRYSKKFTVRGDTQVKAVFSKKKFLVTAQQPTEGGSITIDGATSKTVDYGTEITVTATPSTGFSLTTLTANGTDIMSTKKVIVKESITIKGSFSRNSYKLTVAEPEHGKLSVTGAEDLNAVPYDTELTAVVTPDEGFELKTLTLDDASIIGTETFKMGAKDMTLSATFAVKTFKVEAEETTNGTITLKGYADMMAVPYGTEITVEAKPAEGFSLAKLTANGEDITATKSFVVKENTKVKATFTNATHKVTIEKSENGTVSIDGEVNLAAVPEGTTLKVNVWPNEGFVLDKLTANDEDITETQSFVVEGPTVVRATFKKDNAVESVEGEALKLYPNPAQEYAVLEGVAAGAEVQLYTLEGVEVLRTTADASGRAHLALGNLPAGDYLVKSGSVVVRLLIAK